MEMLAICLEDDAPYSRRWCLQRACARISLWHVFRLPTQTHDMPRHASNARAIDDFFNFCLRYSARAQALRLK